MKTAFLPLTSRIDLKPVLSRPALASIAILLLGLGDRSANAQTGFKETGVGPWDYNTPENWFGGDINGIWDSALSIPASQTITFAQDTVLTTPLLFAYDGAGNQTLRGTGGDRTLTLGGDITVATATTRTVTLGSTGANQKLNIDLGGVTRTLSVTSSRILTLTNVISNGGIIAQGGTINLSGSSTYSGATTINSGAFVLNTSSASIANSDVTINGASLSATSGNSTLTRAKSVTLNGAAIFSVASASSANSVDTVTNALTVNSGAAATVTATALGTGNAQLVAGSLVRATGGAVLFRGTNLGVNTIASATSGAANISFGTAPALVGDGAAGSTTVGIIAGAYGDTTSTGNGFGSTGGLVTYDAANGVRLLDPATEYKTTLGATQTTPDHVRLTGVSGTPLSVNLTSATTTVGSLSLVVSGSGTNSGVTISGDTATTLKVTSGVIYGSQTVTTPATTDAMTITVPKLDLNGKEGIVITTNTGNSGANGNHNAPLLIESEITNDGGNGLTKAGPGTLRLGGAVQSTYSGNTTLNAGILYLAKSASNIAIPDGTTLVMNGGTLLQGNNQIPDNASVTVNGGGWAISGSTSNGNSSSETINNLLITGGSVKNGQTRGGAFNVLGSATFTGGTFNGIGDGSNVTVSGTTSISNGATVVLGASGSTTTFNSKMTLNGGLALSNTSEGAYIPLSLSAGSAVDRNGGQLILASDVTFTGNAANDNTVTINAPTSLGRSGTIALNGTRVWNIGDGAAAVDLTVVPAITDLGATVGSLTKAGEGTLEITGVSTYTGPTTINGGTLLVSGSLSGVSTVEVNDTATLGGIGTIGGVLIKSGGTVSPGASPGTLTSSAFTLESGAIYAFQGGDLVDVNGTLDLNENWTLSLGTGLMNGGSITLFTYDLLAASPDLTPVFDLSLLGFTPGALSLTDTGNSIVLNGVQAVPEPASSLMLLAGIGLLSCRGRRFRQSKASQIA